MILSYNQIIPCVVISVAGFSMIVSDFEEFTLDGGRVEMESGSEEQPGNQIKKGEAEQESKLKKKKKTSRSAYR